MELLTPKARTEDAPGWFRVLRGAPYMAIKFEVVARHRARIEDNHGQTLEHLNARGGLDWYELWCGFNDRPLFPAPKLNADAMRDEILAIVARDMCSTLVT